MPLVFPGSTSRLRGDVPPDPDELVFRDGRRVVPSHVSALLSGIDTVRLTYEDALVVANRRMAVDFVNGVASDIISAHLAEHGR